MYLGSVRFFKHLFLSIILLMIIVPTVITVVLYQDIKELKTDPDEITDLYQTIVEPLEKTDNEQQNTFPSIDYQALYPEMVCEVPLAEIALTEGEKQVYLTFDDGPSEITKQILDTLKEKGIHATFFVVGKNLETEDGKTILKRIVAEGHTVGIHTYSHQYQSIYQSVEAYLADFNKTYKLIYDITGMKAEIYRFPGGSINGYNMMLYQELIAEMTRRGFVYFDWNVSSFDAASTRPTPVDTIIQGSTNVKNYNTAIILMHDTDAKQTTATALPAVIDKLTEKGYGFASLSRQIKPIIFGYNE